MCTDSVFELPIYSALAVDILARSIPGATAAAAKCPPIELCYGLVLHRVICDCSVGSLSRGVSKAIGCKKVGR